MLALDRLVLELARIALPLDKIILAMDRIELALDRILFSFERLAINMPRLVTCFIGHMLFIYTKTFISWHWHTIFFEVGDHSRQGSYKPLQW